MRNAILTVEVSRAIRFNRGHCCTSSDTLAMTHARTPPMPCVVLTALLLLPIGCSQPTRSDEAAKTPAEQAGSPGRDATEAGPAKGPEDTGARSAPAEGSPAGGAAAAPHAAPHPAAADGLPAGSASPSPAPAPDAAGTTETGAPGTPRTPAQTSDERASALGRKLDNSLEDFDGMLLKEKQALESERAARAPGSDQGSAGGENASGVPAVPAGATTDGEADGEAQATRGQDRTGSTGVDGRPPVPGDIPDGHDDDIVARQLREAAEQETDPVLREKLWQEYRNYKNGAGRNAPQP
jgi:hypothetical protein